MYTGDRRESITTLLSIVNRWNCLLVCNSLVHFVSVWKLGVIMPGKDAFAHESDLMIEYDFNVVSNLYRSRSGISRLNCSSTLLSLLSHAK